MSTAVMTLMGPVDKHAVLTEVERKLAAIKTVDEAKHIRDVAEAARVYAKSAQLGLEIQNHAASIKIQAEIKVGTLLAQMPKAKGTRGQLCGDSIVKRPETAPTLAAMGISRTQSHRWQQMAQVPEAVVRKYVADLTAQGYEVTSAGIRRIWREQRGDSLRADSDGTLRWSPNERYRWLIAHLDGLQPGYAALRHLDSITDRGDLENVLTALAALRSRVDETIERIRRQINSEIEAEMERPRRQAQLDEWKAEAEETAEMEAAKEKLFAAPTAT